MLRLTAVKYLERVTDKKTGREAVVMQTRTLSKNEAMKLMLAGTKYKTERV